MQTREFRELYHRSAAACLPPRGWQGGRADPWGAGGGRAACRDHREPPSAGHGVAGTEAEVIPNGPRLAHVLRLLFGSVACRRRPVRPRRPAEEADPPGTRPLLPV